MTSYLPLKNKKHNVKRLVRPKKPFWDRELSSFCREVCFSEKQFTKCKSNRQHKGKLRQIFINKRKAFEKCLRLKSNIIIIL
jgi:hypothetical protein